MRCVALRDLELALHTIYSPSYIIIAVVIFVVFFIFIIIIFALCDNRTGRHVRKREITSAEHFARQQVTQLSVIATLTRDCYCHHYY